MCLRTTPTNPTFPYLILRAYDIEFVRHDRDGDACHTGYPEVGDQTRGGFTEKKKLDDDWKFAVLDDFIDFKFQDSKFTV